MNKSILNLLTGRKIYIYRIDDDFDLDSFTEPNELKIQTTIVKIELTNDGYIQLYTEYDTSPFLISENTEINFVETF